MDSGERHADASVLRTTQDTLLGTTRRSSSFSLSMACAWAQLATSHSRLTNPILLVAIAVLVGGFAAINRFGELPTRGAS